MTRIVRLTFRNEHIDDFLTFFEERKQRIRDVDGCTHLELWQDENNANVFYTYSIWQHEVDLENYRSSLFFQDTWTQVKAWFADKPFAFSAHTLTQLS